MSDEQEATEENISVFGNTVRIVEIIVDDQMR